MIRLIGAALLIGSVVMACGDDSDEARDRARLDRMRQQILALVASPRCADSTDCRFIGLGAKPCGGPWEYLIYSVASVDSTALAQQVATYNTFNEQLNRRYGWISDCSVPPLPSPGCRDGNCVDLKLP